MGGKHLAAGLKGLVSRTAALLGETAKEEGGNDVFGKVEALRRLMVRFREADWARKERILAEAGAAAAGAARKAEVARAFTLYLELVNACENAWRTHRLRARGRERVVGQARLSWVLTAHPTEARAPANIELMRRVQEQVSAALDEGRAPDDGRIKDLLRLAWRAGTFPAHAPRVEDEARHIYSLLTDQILDELLALRREGHSVLLRCWVGGDKDGNPNVGAAELLGSLSLSRERLLDYLRARLEYGKRRLLRGLGTVRPGDGAKVRRLRRALGEAGEEIFGLFPGLVVPLEIRERAGLYGPGSPAAKMVRAARAAARGGELQWYVGGFVISMAQAPADLFAARKLTRGDMPVIPLFELPETLPRAAAILEACWADAGFRREARARGSVEVMLGYSDTGKRAGPLPTRLAIFSAMKEVNAWARKRGVKALFFHGAGGSAGRGGGTIEEQAACWPAESVGLIKQTIQGEMIERTLASPEILRSQVLHAARVQAAPPAPRAASGFCGALAEAAARHYRAMTADPGLVPLLREATPYYRLGAINIGSRPVLRPGKGAELESLRAIPWVLCWTQTRLPLPSWYGAGLAWLELRRKAGARTDLRKALESDALLRSFIRQLGFSLEKSEPLVWKEYCRGVRSPSALALARRVDDDYQAAWLLCRESTSGSCALWDRPWLKESIYYRAPMINPLNLLQLQVLRKANWTEADALLFRETVTGIASGMLTTG